MRFQLEPDHHLRGHHVRRGRIGGDAETCCASDARARVRLTRLDVGLAEDVAQLGVVARPLRASPRAAARPRRSVRPGSSDSPSTCTASRRSIDPSGSASRTGASCSIARSMIVGMVVGDAEQMRDGGDRLLRPSSASSLAIAARGLPSVDQRRAPAATHLRQRPPDRGAAAGRCNAITVSDTTSASMPAYLSRRRCLPSA